jgi:hypothetical protein
MTVTPATTMTSTSTCGMPGSMTSLTVGDPSTARSIDGDEHLPAEARSVARETERQCDHGRTRRALAHADAPARRRTIGGRAIMALRNRSGLGVDDVVLSDVILTLRATFSPPLAHAAMLDSSDSTIWTIVVP